MEEITKGRKPLKKKILHKLFPLIIILFGIICLGYPFLSNYLYDHNAQSEVKAYKEKAEKTDTKKIEEMLKKAREYNKELIHSAVTLTDPFDEKEAKFSKTDYYNLLKVDNTGYMCSLEIPCIGETLPVYHGTSAEVLEKGVGHMEGSSLPVGGKSTHAVLTGHTGINKAKLFTDLTEVKNGDQFYITVLGKILAYEVDAINVVLPSDTSKLNIVDNKDYVTLVTCTPYGENTHRLLVRGKRVKYSPENYAKEKAKRKIGKSQWMGAYKKAMIIGAAASAVILFVIILFRKKFKKRM